MEMEMKFCKTETEMKFLCESGKRNGTTFFGGTDVKMEFPFSTDTKFSFYSGFAWSI
jgi:hypothetical protein